MNVLPKSIEGKTKEVPDTTQHMYRVRTLDRRFGVVSVSDLYTVFIALLPILMLYRLPIVGFGLGTFLTGVYLVYIIPQIFRAKFKETKHLLSLIPFFTYLIIRNVDDTLQMFLYLVAGIHIYASQFQTINPFLFRKTLIWVSVLASFIVITQTILHYVFGYNLQTLVPQIMLEEYSNIKGFSDRGGMFRPAGLFLEPSHFAEYTVIALILLVFRADGKRHIFLELTVVAGMLCTTSGLGIGMCLCTCLFAVLVKIWKSNNVQKLIYLIVLPVGFFLLAFILYQIGPIQQAVNRVIRTEEGYNAIAGRSVNWDRTIGIMRENEKLFGVGNADLYKYGFMTGLNTLLYYYGYIGTFLFALLLMEVMAKRWRNSLSAVLLCFVYAGLVLGCDVVGFIKLIFWFVVLNTLDSNVYSVRKN